MTPSRELDFTYMITNNVGAELILGTSRHSVTASRTALGGGGGIHRQGHACRRPDRLQYHCLLSRKARFARTLAPA